MNNDQCSMGNDQCSYTLRLSMTRPLRGLVSSAVHCSLFIFTILMALSSARAADCFPLARLKYSGGGDWYTGSSMLPNLAKRLKTDLGMNVCGEEKVVEVLSAGLFETPVLFMTGHGRVSFSDEERRALRTFLARGGLLFADDNYGLAESFRAEMDTLYPRHPLRPLPASHPVFSSHHKFPSGLPKIHQHDGKPAVAYGIELDGRIAVLFTHESDLGNGWEDPAVHDVPPALREQALRMGVNVFAWFLEGARAR
jgi:hypothetical protein